MSMMRNVNSNSYNLNMYSKSMKNKNNKLKYSNYDDSNELNSISERGDEESMKIDEKQDMKNIGLLSSVYTSQKNPNNLLKIGDGFNKPSPRTFVSVSPKKEDDVDNLLSIYIS